MGNDPLRLVRAMQGTTELKSDGKQFPNRYALELTFNAGDDWLKDVSFTLKNVSDKTITYVAVGCALFETSDWQKEIAAHATAANPVLGGASNKVGWRPEHALYSRAQGRALAPDSAKRPAFDLAPGQEFTIRLQDPEDYTNLKSQVEAKQPISTLNACDGGVSQIFFSDGTKWENHRYWKPAEEPGRYQIIPTNEAPQISAEMTK
jgi:hypothetical protein